MSDFDELMTVLDLHRMGDDVFIGSHPTKNPPRTFGGLMMAAAAFTQAQSSLRWFVDNFSTIADWRATLQRVASFRYALTTTQDLHDFESRITYVDGGAGEITIDELVIASPGGSYLLKERKVVVKAGERVLIVGAPGTGKTH